MSESHDEQVVLLDERAHAIGTAPKATVHTRETPLHLAFSCYLLNDEGNVLLTRRALSKATWPGVWTNSFCGHPRPGEPLTSALERRAEFELGAHVRTIESALDDFRYRATDASGIVENEICPVFTATLDGTIHPNPDEIAEWAWVTPSDLLHSVRSTPFAFSPWLVLQLPQLSANGALPAHQIAHAEQAVGT